MSGSLEALGELGETLGQFLPSGEALENGIGDAASALEDGPEGIAEQLKGRNDGGAGGTGGSSNSNAAETAKNVLGSGVLFVSTNKGKILGGVLLGIVGLVLIITSLDKKITQVAVTVGKTALETGA